MTDMKTKPNIPYYIELQKFRKFKTYMHAALDEWGVDEYADKDCRIAAKLEDLDKLY